MIAVDKKKSKYVKYFKWKDYVNYWTDECTLKTNLNINEENQVCKCIQQQMTTPSTASNYYSKHAYVVWSKPLHGEVQYSWLSLSINANSNAICNDEIVICSEYNGK